jgi:hypothetical protein
MAMKKVHINITIDEDLNEWLDKMALEFKMNKSKFINNFISVAKSDVKILRAVGLLDLAKAVVRLWEKGLKIKMQNIPLKGERAK